MRNIIGSISVIMSIVGIPISIKLMTTNRLLLGIVCFIWFSYVLIFVGEYLYKQVKKTLAFTLIELIAVITIMSILLTVTISALKTDPSKTDAIVLASQLKLLHTQSLIYDNDVAFTREFVLNQDDFLSEITLSHPDLHFVKGEPLNVDEKQILGYEIEIKHKDEQPILIKVKPFTGKVTFY